MLVLFANNLNFFLKLGGNRWLYLPSAMAIVLPALLTHPRPLSFKKSWKVLLITFGFFLIYISTLHVPYFIDHLIYISVFIVLLTCCYYSSLAFGLRLNFSIIRNLLFWLVFVSILLSLIDLFSGRSLPGWTWFVNIALQELVLLPLIASILLISDDKKGYYLLFVFLTLVFFRESGKTAFATALLLLIFKKAKSFEGKYIVEFIISMQLFFFSLLLFLGNYLEGFDLIAALDKRFLLLYEAFGYIQNMSFLEIVFGFGYDVSNYFYSRSFLIKNSPQLMPVTIFVLGGILGLFIIYGSILMLRNRLLALYPYLNYKRSINAIFGVSLIMLTMHEYFNNPLFYLSITLAVSCSISYYDRLYQKAENLSGFSFIEANDL